MLIPAQHLLQSDRKTARGLYEQELKISGNKERAIAAASLFYRLFGFAFVLFGLVLLVFAWLPSQSN